jgi:hypothetical protein
MSPQPSLTPEHSTTALSSRPTPSAELQRHAHKIPGYLPDRQNNNAPQTFNPDIGVQNIIHEGRYSRAPRVDDRVLSHGSSSKHGGASYGASSTHFTYYRTFTTALHPSLHQKITFIVSKARLHGDQMPELPKRFKDVANHSLLLAQCY